MDSYNSNYTQQDIYDPYLLANLIKEHTVPKQKYYIHFHKKSNAMPYSERNL